MAVRGGARTWLRLAGAMAPLLASPAQGDVLEVNGASYSWIAGGAVAAPISPLSAVPETRIADSAGPAQWRGQVAALAARYDISPALLEAVIWQESRWHTGAVSPAGARGLAQLMPGTARQLGVDPHDPVANLEGGARYLRQQLDSFGGDVEKALAAYNAGPKRVQDAGGIPRIAETRAYVAAILARLSDPTRR